MTPIQEERAEDIDQRCRTAGCSKETAARHHQLFVYDRWDCHPPAEFQAFVMNRWEKEELEDEEHCRKESKNWRPTSKPNAVALWNSDRERQEFYRSRG